MIHGEDDELIPWKRVARYKASAASEKTLLIVPGAGHNDLFLKGTQEYLSAVRTMAEKASASNDPNLGQSLTERRALPRELVAAERRSRFWGLR
ncbi:MAG: alpha/beta hydrolase [Desulfobacteraceae bacterium]|nr:MAG: alpha/beta hydrolase [Desulfobacteraceae bacterium]